MSFQQGLSGLNATSKNLEVIGNNIANGVGQGGFELAGPADHVKLEVLSPSGQVVETLSLGAQNSGMGSFDWPAGAATNDSGFTFRVTATQGAAEVAVTALMRDRVDAVSSNGTTLNIELQKSGTVPYSAVKAFN